MKFYNSKIFLFFVPLLWSLALWGQSVRMPYSQAFLKNHPDHCGYIEFSSHARMSFTMHGQHIPNWSFPENGTPPHFYVLAEGGQTALRERSDIDAIKNAMKAGKFEYEAFDARISGIYDGRASTYVVYEGRHRLNAALEVAHETGNWRPFIELINQGRWDLGEVSSKDRSLHFRSGSSPLREIYDTLDKITPRDRMPSQNMIIRFFQGN